MSSLSLRRVLCAATLASVPSFAHASVSAAPGWQASAVPAAPAGTFASGLALLPNGHAALFDGVAVVEVDPADGTRVSVLYTPPSFVFGSFVAAAPSGSFLLFGNSTDQQIVRIPLDGSPATLVATVQFNFDCAVVSDSVAYVSAAPSFGANQIVRLDLGTGAVDLIADFNGASGPLAFAANGDLFYGEAAAQFPPPVGQQRILRFDAAQVAGAIGPTHLLASDGSAFASGLTSIADFVFDEEGDLVASVDPDGMQGTTVLVEYSPSGAVKDELGRAPAFHYVGVLAFAGNRASDPAIFGASQPASGGTLYALSTDFFSYNDLDTVRPKRATLATTPASPVPAGNVTFTLAGGPESGLALFLVATAAAPEYVAFSGGVPWFLGVAPGAIVATALLPLDAQGGISIPFVHHGGGGGATAFVQAALIAPQGGVGTSALLPITLQ